MTPADFPTAAIPHESSDWSRTQPNLGSCILQHLAHVILYYISFPACFLQHGDWRKSSPLMSLVATHNEIFDVLTAVIPSKHLVTFRIPRYS